MTEALDFEQPAIGRKVDLAQLGEIMQAFADAQVVGVEVVGVVLMVVSVRSARLSSWYCLILVFL